MPETAVLVGFEPPVELKALAETAGAVAAASLTQKRTHPDPAYFIGSGKVEELKALVKQTGSNLVIFDDDLTAAQARNLEAALGVKTIDRTELILDIFARRARSREGKLQVELAQSAFRLTRLTGHGATMSRLGGGIGTRGPGESKLEYDRRRLRDRISELKGELEKVRRERSLMRKRRRASRILVAAIVGYTNSGKSTLINTLTSASVPAENKLFATLDPTTRRLYLPSGHTILLTDTVGFIRKLPHSLVAAFAATLEEVSEADFLLHVVDISNYDYEKQIGAVYNVLEELHSIAKPIVTIFNKTDQLAEKIPSKLLKKFKPAVAISALNKEGLAKLLAAIDSVRQKLG